MPCHQSESPCNGVSHGLLAQGAAEHPSLPEWQLGRFMAEGKPLLAVQQLLIKGLFKPETELATAQVGAILQLTGQACLAFTVLLGQGSVAPMPKAYQANKALIDSQL